MSAAIKLVSERGLERLTLNDVGEAAGYSRGLPAHYFGGKSGLVVALARALIADFGDRLTRLSKDGALQDHLTRAIRLYFQSAAREPVATRALFVLLGEGLNNALISADIAELNAATVRQLEDVITAGIRRGEVRPDVNAKAQAQLMLSSLRGAVGMWLLSPRQISLARIADEMIETTRRALAP